MPRILHHRRLLAVAAVLLTALSAGCNDDRPPDNRAAAVVPPPPPHDLSSRGHRTVEQIRPVAGVALVVHHVGDLSLYLESVDHIAALGASSLTVVTPMFQENVRATEIRRLLEKCPTADQLEAILDRAVAHGLHTTLQPIVLLERAGEKQWRGAIQPDDWDQWWRSYDRFIDWYLDLADRCHIDLLCIGSELNSTEDQLDRWRAVASRVRSRFDGQITYAANWDRYEQVELWPIVDVMSVSSYFEIGRRLDEDVHATPTSLAEAWKTDQDRLLKTADRFAMPLLLSEVGYPSLPTAARYPWDYVADDDTPADHDAQAACYAAFFGAWIELLLNPDQPAAGFCIYAWDPYHHGQTSDTGYGFRGKPAFDLIRRAFQELRSDHADE